MSEPTLSNQPPTKTSAVTKNVAVNVPKTILVQSVLGSRRFSNYFWAGIVTLGGGGFLLESLSSFLHTDLLPFVENSIDLPFFPQGVAMGFYG
jgi:hypothetical protein